MGNALTGKPKGVEPQQQPLPLSHNPFQVLDTQISNLEKRIEHLEILLKAEREKALVKGRDGNKTAAVFHLKKAKQHEKDLTSLHAMIEKLQIQRHTLEQTTLQAQTLQVMDAANKHLEATSQQMSVEKAEQIVEATEEAKNALEEIQAVLIGTPSDTREEEAELEAMLSASQPQPQPQVASVVIPTKSAEEELAQLVEEEAPQRIAVAL